MDTSSYFIKNCALFGSFPSQESVEELEKHGVRYFVNLTELEKEKNIKPYKTQYTIIHYPIKDNYIPHDWYSFSSFIINTADIIKHLKKGELIYIHCRGGHSRSSLVVACLLCHIFNITPCQSLEYTTKCHSSRKIMRDKWRKLSAPQSFLQKKFVYKFFEPLKFYKYNKFNTHTYGFSIVSLHKIKTEEGIFMSAKLAYEFHIDKYCIEHKIEEVDIDEKIILKIMTDIVKKKFNQHKDIYQNLINTGLRPLIEHSKDNKFWSDGLDGKGRNMFGKILMDIRNKYYEENINS
jgi:hypothetical protein